MRLNDLQDGDIILVETYIFGIPESNLLERHTIDKITKTYIKDEEGNKYSLKTGFMLGVISGGGSRSFRIVGRLS